MTKILPFITCMSLCVVLFVGLPKPLCAQDSAAIARAFSTKHKARIVADFADFLRLPNVATDKADMDKNADFILSYIKKRGFTGRSVSAGGAPYVIAERLGSKGAPVVLIYAHFDGQPVIADDWASPPFQPTLWSAMPGRLGATPLPLVHEEYDPEWRLVARSAGDDKAPVIALMGAIDALVAADAMPDVTVKLFLDGEEEMGSPTLAGVLEKVKDELKGDVLIFCDGPMHQSRRRQLVLGVRGSMTVDITTYGPNRPLHSGHYGNWAGHPSDTLMRVLTTLKTPDGIPAIKEFLEDVTAISEAERAAIDAMPLVDDRLLRELGLANSEVKGERIELAIMRPALIIKGLYGGGVGKKSRNIIEPRAEASLNVRLVPGQTPERVESQLKDHFTALGLTVSNRPPRFGEQRVSHLKMTVRPGGYRAFRTPVDTPIVSRLVSILDRLDGPKTLITPTMGGSLPIYLFEDNLDMPIVILPIANHDNNQHGRNENIRLQNLFDAVEIYAEILSGLSKDP